ncbi:MAG: hypothetical protein ACREC0_03460 [Methylocella sp.]
MTLFEELEQAAVLQFATGGERCVGDARLVTIRELVDEIYDGLKGNSPPRVRTQLIQIQ